MIGRGNGSLCCEVSQGQLLIREVGGKEHSVEPGIVQTPSVLAFKYSLQS